MEPSFKSHRLQAAKRPAVDETDAAPGLPLPGNERVASKAKVQAKPKEIGGPSGPEPTRYGDWERNGICYDF